MGAHLAERLNVNTVNLRRSYQSFYAPGVATNRGTHLLYNSGTPNRVVLMHTVSYTGTTGASWPPCGAMQGVLGSHLGSEVPVWRGEAAPSAQHYYIDTATVLTSQLLITPTTANNFRGGNQYPWAILPSGWSYFFQANAAALTVVLSFEWEELDIGDPVLGAVGLQL